MDGQTDGCLNAWMTDEGSTSDFLERQIKGRTATSIVSPRRSPEVVMGLTKVIRGCLQQRWKENLTVLTQNHHF